MYKKIMGLKQTGSIHDYVTTYSALMLEITDIGEMDHLLHFMMGLQPLVKQELRK
jgi:hypothetical protein